MKKLTITMLAVFLTTGLAAAQYTATDLGSADFVTDLSSTGYVSGALYNTDLGNATDAALRFNPGSTTPDSYNPSQPVSFSYWGPFGSAVDDAGNLYAYRQDGTSMVWNTSGNMTIIAAGAGETSGTNAISRLRDVNASGTIAVGTDISVNNAKFWTNNAGTWSETPLPNGGTGGNNFANKINENGVIVGGIKNANNEQVAAYWTNSGSGYAVTELPGTALGGVAANGVNDLANPTIVGADTDGNALVWTWDAGSSSYASNTLSDNGFARSALLDVNDSNLAVGWGTDTPTVTEFHSYTDQNDGNLWVAQTIGTAMMYDIATDTWTDLNTYAPAGYTLDTAVSITDAGDILCNATDNLGASVAVLLSFDTPGTILGDFNGDNEVTLADYTIWADNFGGDESAFAAGSTNGDNEVTLADYTTWADNFGNTAPDMVSFTVVPEPATMSLLGLGGLALLRRRK